MTSEDTSLEKYTSHFIRKGSKGLLKVLLCERRVGDWTELQHIDPMAIFGGARGVMVIVVGNGHDDTSSIPGRDRLYFT